MNQSMHESINQLFLEQLTHPLKNKQSKQPPLYNRFSNLSTYLFQKSIPKNPVTDSVSVFPQV